MRILPVWLAAVCGEMVRVPAPAAPSSVYYLDSSSGDDRNSGLGADSAWRTLEKANAVSFQAGDRLVLKAGGTWRGRLQPKGSGKPGQPIRIDRYGAGPKPIIRGSGEPAAVHLYNQEHWEIANLEITNDGPAEGLRRGVLVEGSNLGRALTHIHLVGLDVHHVRGKLGADIVSKTTGGIAFEVRGTLLPTRFDDILVEGCTVESVDNTGLYTWSDFTPHPRDARWPELRNTGVRIRNNRLSDIGKNAIGIRASEAPVIEYNRIEKAAARLHGNALYVFGCRDAVIQFNEVYQTRFEKIEGAAFDSDYNSEGTLIQYNYSHENGGGLVNLCNNPESRPPRGYNVGTVVRYNISQNETDRVIGFDGPVTDVSIYNNTIYIGPGLKPRIVEFDIFGKSPGYASRVRFFNNIIANMGQGTYLWGDSKEITFSHNCFWGHHPDHEPPDPQKLTADPLFVSPGGAAVGRQTADAYRLRPESPCANSGAEIPENGGRDFRGNALYRRQPDRGAHEISSGDAAPAEGGAVPGLSSAGAAFYIDCEQGDDARDGRSPGTAWKTLEKVNQASSFRPGDSILFRSGCTWNGHLSPTGSGTREMPIRIDRYGTGGLPKIQASAEDTNALHLLNQSFWEISRLELSNRNPSKLNDRTRRGIFVEARGAFVEHIYLRQMVIHDVRGLLALGENYNRGKDSAGIGFEVTDSSHGARFHDLLVDGCEIYGIDSTGIYTKGNGRVYPRDPGWDAIKFTQVVLQNNKIHDIGKNAVIVRQLDGGLVQRNTVWDTAFRCESGNQVFARSCYGTVFQFNEGYLNRATADMDGSAFDADLDSPGTIWQYNYSHDNKFGLITLCTTARDRDIVVRYNISRNDQGRIFNINYNFASAAIYNNLVYVPSHLSPQILWETHVRQGGNFTGRQSYSFDNNIIYNLSPTASYNLNSNNGTLRQTTRRMRNNCFFGQRPAGDPQSMPAGEFHIYHDNFSEDPLLVNPGSGGAGLETLGGYRLQNDSPCIKRGLAIPDPGALDFWGNPLPAGRPDVGPHQWTGSVYSCINPGLKVYFQPDLLSTLDRNLYERRPFTDFFSPGRTELRPDCFSPGSPEALDAVQTGCLEGSRRTAAPDDSSHPANGRGVPEGGHARRPGPV